MERSLSSDSVLKIVAPLQQALKSFRSVYPGSRDDRQPVHTVYGGADLFRADSARRLGDKAIKTLEEYAPDFVSLASAISLPGAERLSRVAESVTTLAESIAANPEAARQSNRSAWFAYTLYQRVREKLHREPVEDFRIDFEDGFGNRPDEEEDHHATRTANEVATGMHARTLPPFLGIRIKPFTDELRNRSIRTLDIFLTKLVSRTNGTLPQNFFITLPKITIPEEAAALADTCSSLESQLGLKPNTLRIELMIETTQSIFDEHGRLHLLPLARAAQGRCVAAHFGTYDYTAGCGITAAHQHMTHYACDFAREAMQVAFAGTGIWLSDGATNILPVPVHSADKNKTALTDAQLNENRDSIHRAWKLHFDHIQHSLVSGFYQGWDLHPAQLVTRYAALYCFFLESLDAAAERLHNFIAKAAQATLVGEVFDDAATGQGLLNFFLRAINCAAITPQEVERLTSLTAVELHSASFVKILEGRKK